MFFSFASPSSSSTSSSVPIFSSCYCCSSSSTSSSSTSSSCFIFYGKCVLIGSLARGSPSGSRWCSGSELKGPAVSNNNNKSIRRINQKWIQQHFFFANKTRVKRAERFPVEISRPLFVNDFQWLHLKPIIMYRRVLKKKPGQLDDFSIESQLNAAKTNSVESNRCESLEPIKSDRAVKCRVVQ